VLATEPSVLLLDEPLAAVDASARADLRHFLRDELRRYPGSRLVVTHDPIEAASLADQLLVLENGHVSQQGPLADVTAHPRSEWVATMVGLNLLAGVAHGTTVSLPGGETLVIPTSTTGPVFAAFRPNAVTLHRTCPDGSARNTWRGTASELYPAGDRARIRVEGPVPLVAEVTASAVAELHLADGGPVWAAVKATEIDVYSG
jgi:molybdate transport system ATP-binding protein